MRVRICPCEMEDFLKTRSWINDDYMREMTINRKIVTEFEQKMFYENIINDSTYLLLKIETIKDEKFIGCGGLKKIDNINQNAELWIYIGEKDYRGIGLGYEATELILKYGFEWLNLNKIYLEVSAKNDSAIKMYKKIGFKKEGELKEHKYLKGQFVDLIILSISKRDFIDLQKGAKGGRNDNTT